MLQNSKFEHEYIIRNGEEWAAIRKPAQYNMLRPLTVQRYFPLMSEVTDDFIQILEEKGTVTDIRTELMHFAVESAYKFVKRKQCL